MKQCLTFCGLVTKWIIAQNRRDVAQFEAEGEWVVRPVVMAER